MPGVCGPRKIKCGSTSNICLAVVWPYYYAAGLTHSSLPAVSYISFKTQRPCCTCHTVLSASCQLTWQQGVSALLVKSEHSFDTLLCYQDCFTGGAFTVLWCACYSQGIRKASSALGGLDGVTTFCEMAVPLVSRLTEKLGLPGNSPEAVDAARDKVMGCWFPSKNMVVIETVVCLFYGP